MPMYKLALYDYTIKRDKKSRTTAHYPNIAHKTDELHEFKHAKTEYFSYKLKCMH